MYVAADDDAQRSLLSRLGKHRMGKACPCFQQLADLDMVVVVQLVRGSLADVRRRHG